MCAHSRWTPKWEESFLRRFGNPQLPLISGEMRGHVKPTEQIPIVRRTADGGRRLDLVHWGLIPSWAKSVKAAHKNSTFNAKSETLAELKSFSEPFRTQRCLVVIDGWYEWTGPAKHKTPHLIHLPEMVSFGIAGLWSAWTAPDGAIIESAAMVTRPTAGPMTRLHTRMPVILRDEAQEAWLDPATSEPAPLLALLERSYIADELLIDAIEAVPSGAAAKPKPQLSLFN
jgi:putative SOS response-associated peptidase YedK